MDNKFTTSSWVSILAPIAWLASQAITYFFGPKWDQSKDIPYRTPKKRRKEDRDEDSV